MAGSTLGVERFDGLVGGAVEVSGIHESATSEVVAEAFATGDSAAIPRTLNIVAWARGMSRIASDAGMSRGPAIVRDPNARLLLGPFPDTVSARSCGVARPVEISAGRTLARGFLTSEDTTRIRLTPSTRRAMDRSR